MDGSALSPSNNLASYYRHAGENRDREGTYGIRYENSSIPTVPAALACSGMTFHFSANFGSNALEKFTPRSIPP